MGPGAQDPVLIDKVRIGLAFALALAAVLLGTSASLVSCVLGPINCGASAKLICPRLSHSRTIPKMPQRPTRIIC